MPSDRSRQVTCITQACCFGLPPGEGVYPTFHRSLSSTDTRSGPCELLIGITLEVRTNIIASRKQRDDEMTALTRIVDISYLLYRVRCLRECCHHYDRHWLPQQFQSESKYDCGRKS